MNELKSIALDRFFDYYKSDVESEEVDHNNVVLSFPVHFSGFHRIEITVTSSRDDRFIISDGAKVIDELRLAGYSLNKRLRERLERISTAARIRVVNNHLVTECTLGSLGETIQRFLEAAKSIGDAYLVQRVSTKKDVDIANLVTVFLAEQGVPYQPRHSLIGEHEPHKVDFYFPPNGVPGLALSVMNSSTRTNAEAWAFRATDIKKANERTNVGVVYDDEELGNNGKSVLNGVLDVAIPSSNIPLLANSLRRIGILKN